MEPLRKPLQGVWNIIRFNRHFYIVAAVLVTGLLLAAHYFHSPFSVLIVIFSCLVILSTLVSLAVSLYIYDLSGLYKLNWLNTLSITSPAILVNINAGFDETTELLQLKYPGASLTVYDFYDPQKHTEVSIKRARKAYPAFDGTIHVSTAAIPLPDNYADVVFLIFAAHEIRDKAGRDQFFGELYRVLKPGSKVVLLEHLRDVPNFMAYNLGFFHFMSRQSWLSTFANTGFNIARETKFTPFITNFVLSKNGNTN
ncbi:class I SAM-dependent methyltransferase [Mucilaginibacter sp. KACC 22773]|jgi:SAM-dependent methyltransferase|uniref:class I SAM-dependent methyltransferase n=1 Tax=Mucilaginibacter sp. KACC 22773 TaxID=3025671 RepID=UPI002366AD67|nr:class I SAM-dependent methyltransferase [Mucilaginibacter sp. KACC 22773]WDF76438.1 class I SAM-dependent methyltransferase [Mucilaginibacter sp. KACC 22773]